MSDKKAKRFDRDEQALLWTVDDVAAYFQASPSWVYKCVADGQIPSLRIRGMLRFVPEQVKAAVMSTAAAGGVS